MYESLIRWVPVALLVTTSCTYYSYRGGDPGDERVPTYGRSDGGSPSDSARTPSGACRVDGDCATGERCVDAICEVAAPCAVDSECEPTEVCDFRGTCVAPSGCRGASDCGAAEVCVEGTCLALEDACHFDAECGPGRSCIDNECRTRCDTSLECAGGTACFEGLCRPSAECESSADCSGAHCVDARCLSACASDDECGAGERCTAQGLCRDDVTPHPFCSDDTGCAMGHLCVSGVCRTPCPSGTHEECRRWDDQLVHCGRSVHSTSLLCFTDHEANPECASALECASGQNCIDAVCR